MSYTAPPPSMYLPYALTTWDVLSPQTPITTTETWPSADLAIYVPVIVRARVVVMSLFFGAGATGTGNIDLGLYDAAGIRLCSSGSVAHAASSNEQVADVTNTTIGPGVYYLACVSSNTSDTFAAIVVGAPIACAIGVLTEASALPLPSTAAFALNQTLTKVPVIGMFFDTRAT